MIQVDADILLIDEVLAVGDAAFQQKCFDVFHAHARRRARRSCFVTHDMGAVEPLLRPRDAARARRASSDRRRPSASATQLHASCNFDRERRGGRRAGEEGRARADGDGARDRRGLVRGRATASAPTCCRRAAACRVRARVRFTTSVGRARRSPCLLENDRHDPLFAASTTDVRRAAPGCYAAGRARPCSPSRFENVFAPGRYHVDAVDRRTRGGGADRSTAARALAAAVVDRPCTRSAGSSTCRCDHALRAATACRVSARDRRDRALGAARSRARPRSAATRGASSTSRWTLAVTEFKLRFFGSVLGYLWQLDAAADAVRRALRRLHAVRELGERRAVLSRRRCCGHRALHVLRRGDRRRRRLGGRPREPGAQDPLPAPGHPAVGRAHRAVQPGAEPVVVLVFVARLRRARRAGAGSSCPLLRRAPRSCSRSARDAALGAVRPLPRHQADLGGRAPGAVLRDARHLRDRGARRVRPDPAS